VLSCKIFKKKIAIENKGLLIGDDDP